MPLGGGGGAAVCLASGTWAGEPLFCTRKTAGAFQTAAKLSAACVSPSLVAPSPSRTTATVSSPLILAAWARPTACGALVASGVHCGATRRAEGWEPPSPAPPSSGRTSAGAPPRHQIPTRAPEVGDRQP